MQGVGNQGAGADSVFALGRKLGSNGAPFGAQMVCKPLQGISKMEKDLQPESFCAVEVAGLPSECVQPLGLQSILQGLWQP